MTEQEKQDVIHALETLSKHKAIIGCKSCAITAEFALKLLKEQRKTGEWYKQLSKNESAITVGGSRTMSCSKCGGWGRKTFAFCPHCGARMTVN